MQIEDSIVVAAPLNEVFAYASDWQHWAEWFKGVSDFRPTTAIERGTERGMPTARVSWASRRPLKRK